MQLTPLDYEQYGEYSQMDNFQLLLLDDACLIIHGNIFAWHNIAQFESLS